MEMDCRIKSDKDNALRNDRRKRMKTGRLVVLRGLLVALSLGFLSLGTFAGLMHQWHRAMFISLNGFDNSFSATLGFLAAGFGCWILAGLLPNDETY
jgi:hypothetical protein